jgi:hypothetical protein
MNPFLIALAAVAVVAIVEIVISSKWNRTYFTTGIPIFINRVESSTLDSVPLEHLQKGSATAAGPQLAFHRYDADVIGFRESGFVQYAPLMRGCIRRDRIYLIQGVRFWRVARALRAVPASA